MPQKSFVSGDLYMVTSDDDHESLLTQCWYSEFHLEHRLHFFSSEDKESLSVGGLDASTQVFKLSVSRVSGNRNDNYVEDIPF